jgi:outer membrane receptor protein involved in Fe transport
VNTSRVVVRGLDLTLNQGFSIGEAEGSIALNSSYLLDYKRQLTPVAPIREAVDTVGNPIDLRVRATGSIDWHGWGATASLNHADGYRDNVSNPRRAVGSWTTIDLQLRYRAPANGWARGLSVALSAQNLFDADPPFVNRFTGFGYDAANADPLGRFVALQIIKSW